jgi:Ca2+-binding RTX toxin-like protein
VAVRIVRSYGTTIGSAGFTVNAMLDVVARHLAFHNAVVAKDFDGYAAASASISLVGAYLGIPTNAFKSLNGWGSRELGGNVSVPGKTTRWSPRTNKTLGYLGSGFGIVQGLTSAMALTPYLGSDDLSGHDKAAIGMEAFSQVGGGIAMGVSEIFMARRIASLASNATRYVTAARVAGATWGPALGMFAGAMVLATSPLEIYGLHQLGRQAEAYETLAGLTKGFGYEGDQLLADLYNDRRKAEGGLFATSMAVQLIGTAVSIGLAATGVGVPIGLAVDLATAVIAGVLKGVQQAVIEGLANKIKNDIERSTGGSLAYFAQNLAAQRNVQYGDRDFKNDVASLEQVFGVNSVIGVSTFKLSPSALQLAADTRLTADLKTAGAFVDRFAKGVVQGSKLDMNTETGKLVLDGAKGGQQLLTFFTPLMAPGTEKRQRVDTGKDSYRTTLEVILAPGGWQISDGDVLSPLDSADTTFDLRTICSRISSNAAMTQVGLNVKGLGGNDTAIVGASSLTFEGGDGQDSIHYNQLGAIVDGISVRPLQGRPGGFSVTRAPGDIPIYEEIISSHESSYGKRGEFVQYRDFKLTTLAAIDPVADPAGFLAAAIHDTLIDVEKIVGSRSNDYIEGDDRDNTFLGDDGNDILVGANGKDILDGGQGFDTVYGGDGDDLIIQTDLNGADKLFGDGGMAARAPM